jgi:ABC-2 type transport system permease protein
MLAGGMGALLYIARIKILAALAYRFEVWSVIAGQAVIMVATLYLWKTAYAGIDQVAGVTLAQMMTYAVVGSMLSGWFTVEIADSINTKIQQGQMAVDLMRPIHPLLLWLFEDLGHSASSLVLRMAGLALFAIPFAGQMAVPQGSVLLMCLPVGLLGYLIVWLLLATVSMVAFWSQEIGGLHMSAEVLLRVLSGSMVPIWFFPDWLQGVCNFLPFVYTYQALLGIVIGKTGWAGALQVLMIQAAWVVALAVLLQFVWSRAARKVMIQGG